MFYAFDRIEEEYGVLISLENEESKNVKLFLLPKEAKEGDILFFSDNSWNIDKEKTEERKKLIEEKFNSLWN